MTRNLVLIIGGAIAGIVVFRWARRKVDVVVAETRPDAVAARIGRGARGAGDQVADFIDDVRSSTRRRESELRAELGMAPIIASEEPAQPRSAARRRA